MSILQMGKMEVEAFLTWLAVERKVSPSTQNQALQAILFLYRKVLEIELPWLDDAWQNSLGYLLIFGSTGCLTALLCMVPHNKPLELTSWYGGVTGSRYNARVLSRRASGSWQAYRRNQSSSFQPLKTFDA